MLESSSVGADSAVIADDRAALLVENSELRARVEAREQRIRLLEEVPAGMVEAYGLPAAHGVGDLAWPELDRHDEDPARRTLCGHLEREVEVELTLPWLRVRNPGTDTR